MEKYKEGNKQSLEEQKKLFLLYVKGSNKK